MAFTTKQPIILVVEDDDDDADLTEMAFRGAKIKNPIVRVKDGVTALDYVFCRGEHAERDIADLPAVVLLDLNLPRMGGLEVLSVLRSDERTMRLPVVILTSSAEDRDRLAAFDQRANGYVRKPVDYEEFMTAARQVGLYWVLLNEQPPGARV